MLEIYSRWLNSNNSKLNKLNSKSLQRGNVQLVVTKKIAGISARNVVHLNPSSTNGNANVAQSTKENSVLNAASLAPSATNGNANAAQSTKENSVLNAANLNRKNI